MAILPISNLNVAAPLPEKHRGGPYAGRTPIRLANFTHQAPLPLVTSRTARPPYPWPRPVNALVAHNPGGGGGAGGTVGYGT
jgi:hypothetical protein